MRRAIAWLWLASGFAAAQQSPEFTGWMKTTATAFHAVEKLEPKAGSEAVHHAEQLGRAYENMIAFWRQRKADDAVKWSAQGKAAAVQLAAAAHVGDAERAAASFKLLGETCRSCHQAYREKLPDGNYQIKMPAEK